MRGGVRGEGWDIALYLFGVDTKNVPSPAISWTKCSDRTSQGFWPVNTMHFVSFLLFCVLWNLLQLLDQICLLCSLNNSKFSSYEYDDSRRYSWQKVANVTTRVLLTAFILAVAAFT